MAEERIPPGSAWGLIIVVLGASWLFGSTIGELVRFVLIFSGCALAVGIPMLLVLRLVVWFVNRPPKENEQSGAAGAEVPAPRMVRNMRTGECEILPFRPRYFEIAEEEPVDPESHKE